MHIRSVLFSFFLLGILPSFVEAEQNLQPRGLEIVAEVNSQKISMERLENALRQELGAELRAFSSQERHFLSTKLLQRLVDRELLVEQARKRNMLPSEQEVETLLSTLDDKLPKSYSLERELSKSGMERTAFSSALRIDLGVKNYLDEIVFRELRVTEDELQKYFALNSEEFAIPREMKLRQIFIAKDDLPSKADPKVGALQRITALRLSALSGEKGFEQLAREYSEAPHAGRGGDLGWITENQLDPLFRESTYGLKPGELGDVLETEQGYYLLKLEAERGGVAPEYEEVKEQVRTNMLRVKRDKLLSDHLLKLRKENQVIIYLR